MTNACAAWKDRLRDAAVTPMADRDLEQHLAGCADCAAHLAELRSRRERLDALLPLLTGGAEPSPGFRTRVVAAAEAAGARQHIQRRTQWALAAAVPVLLAGMIGWAMTRWPAEGDALHDAQKLAAWKAPSDVLLQLPTGNLPGRPPG